MPPKWKQSLKAGTEIFVSRAEINLALNSWVRKRKSSLKRNCKNKLAGKNGFVWQILLEDVSSRSDFSWGTGWTSSARRRCAPALCRTPRTRWKCPETKIGTVVSTHNNMWRQTTSAWRTFVASSESDLILAIPVNHTFTSKKAITFL